MTIQIPNSFGIQAPTVKDNLVSAILKVKNHKNSLTIRIADHFQPFKYWSSTVFEDHCLSRVECKQKCTRQWFSTFKAYLKRQKHILVVHFLVVLTILSSDKHPSKFDSLASLVLARLGQGWNPSGLRAPCWSSLSSFLNHCQFD